MPLAAAGVDRVVVIVWGICTECYTAGNSLESSRRPCGPLLFQSPWYNTRTQGSPLFQHSWSNSRPPGSPLLPSGEFVPSATPLRIPWNCAAILLEHRCPPFLVSHQDSRTTFAAVLLEIPGNQPALHQDQCRQPCLVIPGPQDSIFLASSVGNHNCTIRYLKCVCATH